MVLNEDNGGNWLSLETGNSSKELTVSSRNISVREGVFSYMKKKPASKMLVEAVTILSDDTRGASIPAIIKWITANYAVSDLARLKLNIKKAMVKALKTGTIVRSQTSKGCLGVSGSFVLGKEIGKKSRKKPEKWIEKSSF